MVSFDNDCLPEPPVSYALKIVSWSQSVCPSVRPSALPGGALFLEALFATWGRPLVAQLEFYVCWSQTVCLSVRPSALPGEAWFLEALLATWGRPLVAQLEFYVCWSQTVCLSVRPSVGVPGRGVVS